jgi:hypothetical protein
MVGAVQDNQDTNKQEHNRDEVLAWQRKQRSYTTTSMLSHKVTPYIPRNTYGGRQTLEEGRHRRHGSQHIQEDFKVCQQQS